MSEWIFVRFDCRSQRFTGGKSRLLHDEAATSNGVSVSVTDGATTVVDAINFTTGTINGQVNRTYKNSEDGTAFPNGTKTTITTYLKAPQTGMYEFHLLGIGGKVKATMYVGDSTVGIPYGRSASINGGVQQSDSNWATGNVVPTYEGMGVPSKTVSVNLEEGVIYKIVIETEATSATKDHQLRLNWFLPNQRTQDMENALELAATNNKVVVFVHDLGNGTGEDFPEYKGSFPRTYQRSNYNLATGQLTLLNNIIATAKANNNQVIVVMNIGLPVAMGDWIDDVDSVLNMWLSGQAGGEATALLLSGKENPSGKLPVTFPKTINDTQLGNILDTYADQSKLLTYSEGIYSGYRWYDAQDIETEFDFGYGLSYTSFEYSGLVTEKNDDGYDVTFTVKNTGDVAGTEITELYIGAAEVPDGIQMAEVQLIGFERIEDLQPGESRTIHTTILNRWLSYWDPNADVVLQSDGTKGKWTLAEGERILFVGGKRPTLSAENEGILTETLNIF